MVFSIEESEDILAAHGFSIFNAIRHTHGLIVGMNDGSFHDEFSIATKTGREYSHS